MGTSAFDPIVLADVRSVKNKIDISGITQGVYPFAAGDVIRYDPATDKYLLAMADSQVNATILGVIESISGNDMTIVYSGEINLPDSLFTSLAGSTSSQVLYLSDTNPGKLTSTAPSFPGSVIKPVVVISGTLSSSSGNPLGNMDGIVINTVGTTITGDSTVDLSDIQPVGAISAYAGPVSSIPTGWQVCDGGLLDVATYYDLYTALNNGSIYGFVQGATLTFDTTNSTVQLNSSNLVGAKFVVARPNFAFECTLLSGTVDTVGNIVNSEIFVSPLTSDSQYHNSLLQSGDIARMQILVNGTITAINAIYTVSSSGGLAKTKFSKPDIRSRFILGDSRGSTGVENTTFRSYTLGLYGGEEEHTLTTEELPNHSHSASSASVNFGGNATVSHNLSTNAAGSHGHNVELQTPSNGRTSLGLLPQFNYFGSTQVPAVSPGGSTPAPNNIITNTAGTHTHGVTGTIQVSVNSLNPVIVGNVSSVGDSVGHNNVPQHVVMYWIIKVRKDSYAKILKLGPSSGGAVLAKNTAKKWARMSSPGAGATVDISYGSWGLQRLGTGNYVFTHNYFNDVNGITSEASKYIVEATVTRQMGGGGGGAMLLANAYGTSGGYTFGVRVYDIVGATNSDSFDFLNIIMYGGGTAI